MNIMQQTIDYTTGEGNMIYLSEINAVFNINIWPIILFTAFFLILIFLRRIIQKIIQRGKYAEHTIFLIRLPKDKPKENREEKTVQNLHEEIAKGETIFASIGGLRAQRGVIAWLLGRNDHFSFEIVANQKKICFYVVAPKKMARYIEQQAHAHYPEAVIEEVDDYNIFHPQGITAAGFLKTRRSFIFPLKTYDKMETDPMNSMINIISKLDEHEGIAIQYVIRSAKGGWHRKAAKVVKEVNKGKTLVYALKLNYITRGLEMLGALAKSIKPPTESEKQKELQRNPQKLSAMEEEMLKGIEEKNSKAGLDVNVRVIISAQNKGKARLYLDNISSAFSQYNHYEYGNCFKNQISRRRENTIINHFIYRYFDNRTSFLLNTEELASMFHFPLPGSETPNILWLTAKHAAAPTNIPDQGIILGINTYREITKDIKIKREDRRRHTYIIGKSGVGKSILLANMAIQDILNGEGVCVIDPHGDLIQDVLRRVPPERAEDVILFAPADIERPLALNLLEYDSKYPEQKTFVINEMIKIFDKLYDLKATGGPIFEQYMRNALLLIMDSPESGSTLMEVPKVLADAEFRKMKIEKCKDPTVVDFWKKEAEKAGGDAALANIVPYITSKLTQFISNDTMRPIIAQQNSSFNLRSIMDKQKILLVDLSKGQVGEMNAFLLGMILVGKILMSALSRSDMPQEKRKDFYLYIDEFQNFTTDSICSILSEARKYSLNLIMAHQYLGQLVKNQDTSIKDAVFGNVGTWILFKIGSEDAEVMEKEFAPVFNQYDLINIEKYTAYVKLLIDNTASRPFSMKTLWPLTGIEREDMASKIKSLSRLKYGQDRNMIEAEIMSRSPSPVIS
ncbi:MAG: type IV secretory system conjugative DNA transfer family protein [Patescibacteria group bacterium]|nr:type IV secretion system DNA-binding domain-containing protein [Patescibacteria group bacterium]